MDRNRTQLWWQESNGATGCYCKTATQILQAIALTVLVLLLSPQLGLSQVRDLQIDIGSSEAYLPYSLDSTDRHADYHADRAYILRTLQVLLPASPFAPGTLMVAFNPVINQESHVQFELREYPQWTCQTFSEFLTISDWLLLEDLNGPMALAVGRRNDSVFAIRIGSGLDGVDTRPTTGEDEVLLAAGDGQSTSFPKATIVLIDDYDLDGVTEAFIYIDSRWSTSPRRLICLEIEPMNVRWSRDVSVLLDRHNTLSLRDSIVPGLIFTGYNPRNGISDSLFDDRLGCMAIIDGSGVVVCQMIRTLENGPNRIIRAPGGKSYFVFHRTPLVEPDEFSDTMRLTNSVSKIDAGCEVMATAQLDGWPKDMWLGRFDNRPDSVLYARFDPGHVWVFDTSLNLIAKSTNSMSGEYIGTIRIAGRNDTSIVFSDGVYSFTGTTLERLLAFPRSASYCQTVAVDSAGGAVEIVYGGSNWYTIASISEKSAWQLLSIAYVRNQKYVLMVLSGLLVGLVLVNYYRRRTKSNLGLIAQQKDELERAHQALKEAQQTIIEQEKYKQAKDIAGGFAHEIRNALLPIDGAMHLLSKLERDAVPSEKRSLQHQTIKLATSRAFNLTELISQYTRLDTERTPEDVSIHQVIRETLAANRQRIEDQGVTVDIEMVEDISVQSNRSQFAIVINNLLLNSLDALTDSMDPRILIQAEQTSDAIVLSFEDNGCGMEPSDLARAFDTFFSTKPRSGKGLGLSLVKKIIEMYDGNIVVTSEQGQRTRFRIELKPTR